MIIVAVNCIDILLMLYHKVPSYYYKVITEFQIKSGDEYELFSINPPGSCLACEVASRLCIIPG